MQNSNFILFVVVLYGQKYELTNVYNSLLIKVSQSDILIWDNSLDVSLNTHLNSGDGKYIYSNINVGVSVPYNYAGKYAFQNNYTWMILLDQDTIFANNFCRVLDSAILKYPDVKMFCPIHRLPNDLYLSPVKLFLKFTRPAYKQISGIIDITKYTIINSGLVVNVDMFRKVGGYNEKVFLDYSDFQFIERFADIDPRAYCLNSVCIQDFSNDYIEKKKLLTRFSLFCQSLKECKTRTTWEMIEYKLVVFKRCLSLAYRLKSFQPFSILYNYYIR